MRRAWAAAAFVAIGSAAAAAPVVPLPPADLGQTNILDAEGGPGGLVEVIMAGSAANRLADADGHDLPGRQRQRTGAFVLHPIYVSHDRLVGAFPGVEVLVPVSVVHNQFGPGASGRASGIGDVTFAAFLQWSGPKDDPHRLSVRAAVQIVAPTGAYHAGAPVSLGAGVWQVSPYVAVTKRLPGRLEISGRLIFDHSGTSDLDQNAPAFRVHPGSFLVLDLSASAEVSRQWRLGVGGYALQQTSTSRVGGDPVGVHQRVLAVGPVARFEGKKLNLLAGVYQEFAARQRPSGISASLRIQRPF